MFLRALEDSKLAFSGLLLNREAGVAFINMCSCAV